MDRKHKKQEKVQWPVDDGSLGGGRGTGWVRKDLGNRVEVFTLKAVPGAGLVWSIKIVAKADLVEVKEDDYGLGV